MTDSTLQELDQLAQQARQTRQPFERPWFLNLAAYQGDQWLFWAGGQLKKPNLSRHRVMFTDNRIIGIIRTEVAKLTKDRPAFVVTPRSGDEDDVSAALIGEQVLEYLWGELRLGGRLRSALLWARICSAGFWKVFWDSHTGESVEVLIDSEGNPVSHPSDGRMLRVGDARTDEFLQMLASVQGEPPELSSKKVAQGDVCVEVRSPFELLPDPLAEEGGLDEAEWVIEESIRSKDYVQERYNVDVEPDADAVAGVAESRMPGQTATSGKSGSYKGVRVRELWHRTGSKHTDGRRAVWIDKKVLLERANRDGDLPYIMFPGIPVPGRFWPTSTVEQLRGPQTELNKTRSQIRENAARFGNLSLLKPRQSNVRYAGVPGEEVEYDITFGPEGVPQFLKPPEMPVYVQQELDRMEASLNEISGQHEVSRGNVPAGVTAAAAINLLQEQDESRLAIDVQQMEESLALAGSKVLDLVGRFYTDERTVKIAGEDGAWDIFDFRGSMLKGNTDVEVQAGSGMPRSKAAKQAAMQELLGLVLQYGLPVKPRDLRKFFKDYEVGGLERLFATVSADERQINTENRQLARGEELPINTFDDDELHIEGHEEFQKSAIYRRLGQDAHAVFEAHVNEHRARFTAAQEEMARAASGAGLLPEEQGLPGSVPTGSNDVDATPQLQEA